MAAMEGSTTTVTETEIAGLTVMEGSTATDTAKKSTVWKGSTATTAEIRCSTATAMETGIDGSTAKECSMSTATAKKLTVWKGLTEKVTAMEADGRLDRDGNGINN